MPAIADLCQQLVDMDPVGLSVRRGVVGPVLDEHVDEPESR